jgi:hypothetical protein
VALILQTTNTNPTMDCSPQYVKAEDCKHDECSAETARQLAFMKKISIPAPAGEPKSYRIIPGLQRTEMAGPFSWLKETGLNLSFRSGELCAEDQRTESLIESLSDMAESVTSMIASGLKKVLGFLGAIIKSITPLIIQLATSLVGFIVQIYIFTATQQTTMVKGILGMSIMGLFTSFCISMNDLLDKMGYKWCVQEAKATATGVVGNLVDAVTSVTKQQEVHANSDISTEAWVKIGVTSIVAVLLGGLAFTKAVEWKTLMNGCDLIDKTRKVTTTVTSVAEFIMTNVLGMETTSDYAACLELESLAKRGEYLQQKTPAWFIQHPEDHVALRAFATDIIKVTKEKMSKEASPRYITVRNLILQMHKNLYEKSQTVNAILETKQRQATQAFVFSGEPGVGKSELCKWIVKQIAPRLNYFPALYVLNKKDQGFYEPYGGQPFGIYNEWMAMRSDDPILKDFNLICSSDPVNFEGAALECKIQPNRLKALFLTMNMDNPDLTNVMNLGAAKAVWDRTYHVRVEDPECKGRDAPNPHRKPDFSHLKFRRIIHNGITIEYGGYVTMQELLARITGRLASAELDFVREVLTDSSLPDADRNEITSRATELSELLAIYSAYDPDKVIANSWGRDFFCVRMQGSAGCGKTTLTEQIACPMSTLLGLPIQLSRDSTEFVPNTDEPLIYVFDDWVDSCNQDEYLIKTNRTHPKSMFIITTNECYKSAAYNFNLKTLAHRVYAYIADHKSVQPYDARTYDGPPGVLRRIGLQGSYIDGENRVHTTDPRYSQTYTFNPDYSVRDNYGCLINRDGISERIFKSFRSFLDTPDNLLVLRSPPPIYEHPAVAVTAPNNKELIEVLKSDAQIFRAFVGKHPKVSFQVSAELVDRIQGAQTTASMWHVPQDTGCTDDDLYDIFVRMSQLYARLVPKATLEIRLVDSGKVYYYQNHVCHIYSSNTCERETQFEVGEDKLIYYKSMNNTIVINSDAYVSFKYYKQYTQEFSKLSMLDIMIIDRWISDHLADSNQISDFKLNVLRKKFEAESRVSTLGRRLYYEFTRHPIFWLSCGLITLIATGYIVGKFVFPALKQIFKEDEPETVNHANEATFDNTKHLGKNRVTLRSNEGTFDTRRHLGGSRIQVRTNTGQGGLIRPEVPGPLKKEAKRTVANAFKQGCLTEKDRINVNQYEAEIETFLVTGEFGNDTPALAEMLEASRESLPYKWARSRALFGPPLKIETKFLNDVTSNMISAEEVIQQKKTPIEEFQKTCTKIMYLVKNQSGGLCYGIGLHENYILTVSHMFASLYEDCEIQSSGVSYDAQVVYFERKRDLAVVRVSDKTFPMIPNTSRHFHAELEATIAHYGFFLRCTPGGGLIGGYINHMSTVSTPLTDCNNPNFRLSSRVIMFTTSTMDKVRTFVKLGDCGFPLVTTDGNHCYRIAGLHNAYNESEKVFFSLFTRKDHEEFLSAARNAVSNGKPNPPIPEMVTVPVPDIGMEFLLPETYYKAIENIQPNLRYEECEELRILGYSEEMAIISKPHFKQTQIDIPGMRTPLTKVPAAFNLDWVDDSDALAKTVKGVPDPLFTQALKYDCTKEYDLDGETLSWAVSHAIDDCYARYGDCEWLRNHEVLNGIHGDALGAFDPTTSGGPLLKILYGVPTKEPLLETIDDNPVRTFVFKKDFPPAQMVQKHYREYVKSIVNGGPPPMMISRDCAKVELLNVKKASKGKVRLFNEIDFALNMFLKKFFGDWVNKVITGCSNNVFKIGQNPYKEATIIYREFERMTGVIVSTDFSAFDKQLPSFLIYGFCKVAAKLYARASQRHTPEEIDEIYSKIFFTLTYCIHTCRGTIYCVNRGNESGVYTTTLLNCVAVRIMTMYTVIGQWKAIFKFTPTLSEILKSYKEAIYGDDRVAKFAHYLRIDAKKLTEDSAKFALKCTPSKSRGECDEEGPDVDFCSRQFYISSQYEIVFPALNTDSIYAMLHWTASTDKKQILENIDNCLFEAALHDDDIVFDICLHDSYLILDRFSIPRTEIYFHSKNQIRARFIAYLYDYDEIEWITRHSVREEQNISESLKSLPEQKRALSSKRTKRDNEQFDRILIDRDRIKRDQNLIERYLSQERTATMPNPDQNPISAVLEALQACRIPDKPVEDISAGANGSFNARISLLGREGEGTGSSKQSAKRIAYLELYNKLKGEFDLRANESKSIIGQAKQDASKICKAYMYASVKRHIELATDVGKSAGCAVVVLATSLPPLTPTSIRGIRYDIDDDGTPYVLSHTSDSFKYDELRAIYLAQPRTVERGLKIFVTLDEMRSNMKPPVAESANLIQDTSSNPGLTTVPHLNNVVPVTETVPASVPNEAPMMGAYEPLMPSMNLNPSGPPNMMSAGAIAFDLKDLVYNQFIDCNEMMTYTDDTADGAILFQIPYDPKSKWMNPYAQAYINLHERYAGDLEYRFTVVGNQTFSGFLGFCWYPHKVDAQNMTVSEAMKYNYIAESINQPFSAIFRLSDARQTKFWRSTSDTDQADIDQRPHLICFVILTAVSPLKEGIKIRIRVASKLSDGFQVSNPIIDVKSIPDDRPFGISDLDYKKMLGSTIVPSIARPLTRPDIRFHAVLDGSTFPNIHNVVGDFVYTDLPKQAEHWTTSFGRVGYLPGQYILCGINQPNLTYMWCDFTKCTDIFLDLVPVSDGGPNKKTRIEEILNEFFRTNDIEIAIEGVYNRLGIDLYVRYLNSPDKLEICGTEIETTEYVQTSFISKYGVGHITFISPKEPKSINWDGFPQPLTLQTLKRSQIIGVSTFNETSPMPVGWRHLAITPELPYAVAEGVVTSHNPDHISLGALMQALSQSAGPNECLQVEVSDKESARPIMTCRYLLDRRCFVVNVGDQKMQFGTSLRSCEFMYISAISIVQRSTAFPLTALSGVFADNQVHPEVIAARREQNFR